MAAIMQQSVQDTSAARAFLQEKMSEHPNLAGALAIGQEIAGWFLNGHFLVWLGQWVVLTCGRIAEKGMLFAVLWLTADYIAYDFFAHLLGGTATTLSVFSLLALTILPEVILYSAVITTLNHALAFMRNRSDYTAFSWTVLYGIPTLAFVCMTVGMLYQLAVSHYHFQQAGDITLVIRVLAGWFFSLVTLIHAAIDKRHEQPIIVTPMQQANGDVTQELREEMLAHLALLSEQITTLQTMQITAKCEPAEETETDNTEAQIVDIEDYRSEQQPHAKVTRKLTTRNETTAKQKAQRIVKRNPGISASELATKASISRQYARTILAERA